ALDLNAEIFEKCNTILSKGEALLIFPEGNHGQQRRLRPLSKGFTRIVFGALEKQASIPISVIPVGLNYTYHQSAGSGVSIYFGDPINPAIYDDPEHPRRSAQHLKEKVAGEMKQLITHIEDVENYDHIMDRLQLTNPDYLDPVDTNKMLDSIDFKETTTNAPRTTKSNFFSKLVRFVITLNNLIPLGLWYGIRSRIKDPVFIGSLKFCTGLVLVPIGYLLQTYLVYFIVGGAGALAYGAFCLTSLRWRSLV
ncbi:MAG: 1-acyl-sn-glycerol-3-phosphate acyltransferase, partial [Cyclobacteriaceae bacterium]